MSKGDSEQHLIACHSCDQLHDMQALEPGQKARCQSCGAVLSTCYEDPFSKVLAFSISGLIFFVISVCYPFMSFSSMGLESVMTLPQAMVQVSADGMWYMPIIVGAFILVLPALVTVLSGLLGLSLAAGWRNHWSKDIARFVFFFKNWCMVEVFFFGVLVSLVKIMHMAHVTLGIAFWAYAAFSICFTLSISRLDRFYTWQRIDELKP